MNSRLVQMIERGALPLRGGQWIDTYNQITDPQCAGTIIAGINAKNHYYVMEEDYRKTLDLSLTHKWYDMIKSGEKKEEYREIKNYWVHRLVNSCCDENSLKSDLLLFQKNFKAVRFHRGQGGKETMLWEFKALKIGRGKPEWGAPDKDVFIIQLGEPIEIKGFICPKAQSVPINTMPDGTSMTIKRQYQQTSRANLEQQDALGATGMESGYRIRKLTPRECFRLMGVEEPDIDKLLAAGISNSQLYKMAGNSIVVNTLAAIFRQLFIGNFNKQTQTEIF